MCFLSMIDLAPIGILIGAKLEFQAAWAHVHYFPSLKIYQVGLELGPRQVPVWVRIAEK